MSRAPVTLNIKPMTEAFRHLAEAAERAAGIFIMLGGYSEQLREMLAEQHRFAEGQRRGHWIGLGVAIPMSFLMFAFMAARGITHPVAMCLMSAATGWFILKDLYWATYWDNRIHEIEETQELLP